MCFSFAFTTFPVGVPEEKTKSEEKIFEMKVVVG